MNSVCALPKGDPGNAERRQAGLAVFYRTAILYFQH